jgi:hypothetical protein
VPDWHFEWHFREDQKAIMAGAKAMQCPLCSEGVGFDGFAVSRSEQQMAERSIQQAARWARIQNQSLMQYLQTTEGRPFAAFWSHAEVLAADNSAAAEPQ